MLPPFLILITLRIIIKAHTAIRIATMIMVAKLLMINSIVCSFRLIYKINIFLEKTIVNAIIGIDIIK